MVILERVHSLCAKTPIGKIANGSGRLDVRNGDIRCCSHNRTDVAEIPQDLLERLNTETSFVELGIRGTPVSE